MVAKDDILNVLKTINTERGDKDIVEAGHILEIGIVDDYINIRFALPNNDQSAKMYWNTVLTQKVKSAFPDSKPNIMFANEGPKMSKKSGVSGVKNIIAVASGKGGVGKSTVSTNLALALKEQGFTVGLLDADLYGPSVPTMFGVQGSQLRIVQQEGKERIIPIEKFGMPVMSMGFIIKPEQAVVLRGPRLGSILKQFLDDVLWPNLDFLLIDLPPGTGDIQLSLVQTVPLTGAIIVTTPQEVSVIDAVKAANMFRLENVAVPILGIVENMAFFTPDDQPNKKYHIFGKGGGAKMAQMSESELLGQIPITMSVREGGDNGMPVVMQSNNAQKDIFMDIAKKLVTQVDIRNKEKDPTKIVQVN